MRKRNVVGLTARLSLLFVLMIPNSGASHVHSNGNALTNVTQSDCSDSTNDCKLPVKYLGQKDACACFACEFGRRTQRVVCTANERDKLALMTQSRRSN